MKGQVLTEFLIIFLVFLWLILIYLYVFSDYFSSYHYSDTNLRIFSSSHQLASAINSVFIAGPGASYNFSADLNDFEISINKNSITVNFENRTTSSASLITENVVLLHNVNEPEISIRNNGGVIEIR
ncbi:MAG: hypothetical protein ABII22_01470 [Candidatus Micrarchaeota archaeon]